MTAVLCSADRPTEVSLVSRRRPRRRDHPPADMADVVAQLAELTADHTARTRPDAMAATTLLYGDVAGDIVDRLVRNDGLGHPEFFHDLAVLLAHQYLTVARGSNRRPVPEAWRMLLEHRTGPAVDPTRFTAATVTVHLGYDLPQAVARTATLHGRSLGPSQHLDHAVLWEIFTARLGRQPAPATTSRIGRGAEPAWRHAQQLWTLRGRPHQRDLERADIDCQMAKAGRAILDGARA